MQFTFIISLLIFSIDCVSFRCNLSLFSRDMRVFVFFKLCSPCVIYTSERIRMRVIIIIVHCLSYFLPSLWFLLAHLSYLARYDEVI